MGSEVLEPWAALSHWGVPSGSASWVLSQGWGQGHWLGPSEAHSGRCSPDPKGGWGHGRAIEKMLALGSRRAWASFTLFKAGSTLRSGSGSQDAHMACWLLGE